MKQLWVLALSFGLCGAAHAQFPANNTPWKKLYDICAADQTPQLRLTTCDAALLAMPEGHTDTAWPHWYKADAKLSLKDFDGAIAESDLAAQKLPTERHILNMQCWVRAVANRDLDVARKACDAANAENPDDPGQWDSAGLLALRQHRWKDAQQAFAKGLSIDRGVASSRYGLALANIALSNDAVDSKAIMEGAVKLQPTVAADYKGYGLSPDDVKALAKKYPPKQ